VRAAAVVTFAGVVFLLGAATATLRGWGDSTARLELRNSSGKPIRLVEITLGTCGERKYTIVEREPPVTDPLWFSLPLCGEGGYTLRVTHADGSAVSSQGGYVQRGNHIIETVEVSGVKTSYGKFRY